MPNPNPSLKCCRSKWDGKSDSEITFLPEASWPSVWVSNFPVPINTRQWSMPPGSRAIQGRSQGQFLKVEPLQPPPLHVCPGEEVGGTCRGVQTIHAHPGQARPGLQCPRVAVQQLEDTDPGGASQGFPALRQGLGWGWEVKGAPPQRADRTSTLSPYSDPRTFAHAVPRCPSWANCYSL